MASEDETNLWKILRVVLMTAGAIYLLSLVTWFAHWTVMLAAVGGIGYLTYRLGSGLVGRDAKPKRLERDEEFTFEGEFARLEAEERELDVELGL